MATHNMELVLMVNMLAIAINFSEFSSFTIIACNVLCGVYTLVKIIETLKK